MICKFAAKGPAPEAVAAAEGAALPPTALPQAVSPVSAGVPCTCVCPTAPGAVLGEAGANPLAPVLAGLVGHEVKVIVGFHCYAGRVLQPDPLTLVGPGGEVSVISGRVSSVAY